MTAGLFFPKEKSPALAMEFILALRYVNSQLEKFIQENNTAKWFCGFNLLEQTTNFSVFSKIRSLIGTETLAKIFTNLAIN